MAKKKRNKPTKTPFQIGDLLEWIFTFVMHIVGLSIELLWPLIVLVVIALVFSGWL